MKYSEYVDSGEYKAQVDLGEFIRRKYSLLDSIFIKIIPF